uniref:Crp/Fnr family transcriptional regulator n=1 Tax=Heterorhabditis bacteriophora TaxID=37862 RepID=A0A1I7X0V5_HETBA
MKVIQPTPFEDQLLEDTRFKHR